MYKLSQSQGCFISSRLFLWGNVRLSHLKMASASCHCTRLASSMPNCALPGFDKPKRKRTGQQHNGNKFEVPTTQSLKGHAEATLKRYFNLLGNTQPNRRSRVSQQLLQNLPRCAPIGELSMHTFTRWEISASAA